MILTLRENWALFLGIGLLTISNGLLGTVLTIRGYGIGFSEATIGLMQAGYPLGALLGCVIAPKLVEKVGHIRAFGALASLCSTAAIVHLITVDAWTWGVMRLLAGFCYPGLYVVAESWLNAKATNLNRARILSIYFVVAAAGSSTGSALAAIEDPNGVLLFGATSILISISLVPMLLSAVKAPDYAAPDRLPARALFAISPTAMLVAGVNGVLAAVMFLGLPLYGLALGLSAGAAAGLVVTSSLAGAVFQYPLGWMSDRVDRRIVMSLASIIAAAVAFALAMGVWPFGLLSGVALLSGLTFPIYSIAAAHANDQLAPGQIIPASGTMVLVLNLGILGGALSGPALVGAAGPRAMMVFVGLLSVAMFLVASWRAARVNAPEETGTAQALNVQGLQVGTVLHPEAERDEPAGGDGSWR